jgi:N utilization substance protein B
MSLRHQVRIVAMQVLSSITWRKKNLEEDINVFINNIKREFLPQKNENDFFESIIYGVIKERDSIDQIIQKHAPKFKLENIATIDRVILEIAMFELLHTKTPFPIIINESIEVAKEFAGEGTPRFVNGVLASYKKSLND